MATNNSSKFFDFPNTILKTSDGESSVPRTFFSYLSGQSGQNIVVTPGTINNFIFSGKSFAVPEENTLYYISAGVTSGTSTVTSLDVLPGTSVPADTSLIVNTVIASGNVNGANFMLIPLAWNYSQLQKCGNYLWGGFPS